MASDNGGWKDLNEDKLDYDKRCRDRAHDNDHLIDRRGSGLRSFVEQELNTQAVNRNGSSETLVKGKIYLRQMMPSGEFEMLVYRGRSAYDAYYSFDREELVRFAESLQEGK